LHFCTYEPATDQWLDGENGNEATIRAQSPWSPAFKDYIASKRAESLLSVTSEWADQGMAAIIRYEDMVSDTIGTVAGLADKLSWSMDESTLSAAIAHHTFEKSQMTAPNRHFWKGKPGLWRDLLPFGLANSIYKCHNRYFKQFGYGCNPKLFMSGKKLSSNWLQVC
jgi:hypothetical protein